MKLRRFFFFSIFITNGWMNGWMRISDFPHYVYSCLLLFQMRNYLSIQNARLVFLILPTNKTKQNGVCPADAGWEGWWRDGGMEGGDYNGLPTYLLGWYLFTIWPTLLITLSTLELITRYLTLTLNSQIYLPFYPHMMMQCNEFLFWRRPSEHHCLHWQKWSVLIYSDSLL